MMGAIINNALSIHTLSRGSTILVETYQHKHCKQVPYTLAIDMGSTQNRISAMAIAVI